MHFAKYEATGNDFIMIDCRRWDPELSADGVRRFCRRRTGPGADGLIMMYWSRYKEQNERILRVVKMRGHKINSDDRPMEITDEGVIVYATQIPLSLAGR